MSLEKNTTEHNVSIQPIDRNEAEKTALETIHKRLLQQKKSLENKKEPLTSVEEKRLNAINDEIQEIQSKLKGIKKNNSQNTTPYIATTHTRKEKPWLQKLWDNVSNWFSSIWKSITEKSEIKESKTSIPKTQYKHNYDSHETSNDNETPQLSNPTGIVPTPKNLENLTPKDPQNKYYGHNSRFTKQNPTSPKDGINCVTSIMLNERLNKKHNTSASGKKYTYGEYAKTDPTNNYGTYFKKLGIPALPQKKVLEKINTPENYGKQYLLALGSNTHGGILTVTPTGELLFSHASPSFIKTIDGKVYSFSESNEYKTAYRLHQNGDKRPLKEIIQNLTNIKRTTDKTGTKGVIVSKIKKDKPAKLTFGTGKNIINIADTIDFNGKHGGFYTVPFSNYCEANQNSTKTLYIAELHKS